MKLLKHNNFRKCFSRKTTNFELRRLRNDGAMYVNELLHDQLLVQTGTLVHELLAQTWCTKIK